MYKNTLFIIKQRLFLHWLAICFNERSVARELECKVRDVCTQALTRVLAHVCGRLRLRRKKRKSSM